ncbi:MAG: GGDEF domain-containing protein [Bacillota bacterium]
MLKLSNFNNSLEPLVEYLDRSEKVCVVVLDDNMIIKNCNRLFLKLIESENIPVNQNMLDFLLPENQDMVTKPPKSKYQNLSFTLISGLGNQTNMFGCLYNLNKGYLLLGERAWIADDRIIHEISKMNNELANMTRELNKKNTELEKLNVEVNNLSRTDDLTGIANRRYFLEYYQKIHAYANRHEIPLSIVMADIDHFKTINDRYGHFFGDRVLKEFASLLIASCRSEDMAARFGGEEFIILLMHASAKEGFCHAERIRSKVEAHLIGENNLKITASFGVASMEKDEDTETLMRRADDALYKAKDKGRNRVELAQTLQAPLNNEGQGR